MAIRYACDACGTSIEKPHIRGQIRGRHYCDTCVPAIDAYLRARDALHTELAATFNERLATIKQEFHATRPEAKLPDE